MQLDISHIMKKVLIYPTVNDGAWVNLSLVKQDEIIQREFGKFTAVVVQDD